MPTYRRESISDTNYECSIVKSTVSVSIKTEQVSRFNDFRDPVNINNIATCEGISRCGVKVDHGNGSASFKWEKCPLLQELKKA